MHSLAIGVPEIQAMEHRKGVQASSSSHGLSLAGQVERTPQTLPRHYNAATSAYRRPGWQHRQHNSPGFCSRQKHVNSTGATVVFSHRTPQRGINQDVTQEVVFFPPNGNLRKKNIITYYISAKKKVSKEQENPLAGRAGFRV